MNIEATTKNELDAKILIVENNQDLGDNMSQILIEAGYNITRINTCFGALAAIEDDGGQPFAVIIATYQISKMNGEELLKNARTIAPDTQRILIIESPEINSIIKAINRAGIHSCLSLPLQEELFLSEISQRYECFQQIKKKERLLKITNRQNKQLYQLALKLKEKNNSFARQIKREKRLLQAVKIKQKKYSEKKKQHSLIQLLDLKGIEMSPGILSKEFKSTAFKMKCFMEDFAAATPITLQKLDNVFAYHIKNPSINTAEKLVDEILSRELWIDRPLIDQMLNLFLEYEFLNAEYYAEADSKETSNIDEDDKDFILTVFEDNLSASIQIKTKIEASSTFASLQKIKSLLKKEGIVFGIPEDTVIEEWLTTMSDVNTPLIIAKGIAPQQPVDAEIKFFFDTEFLHPGKIESDGTIDFRERGTIPFVNPGTLLAEKQPCRNGAAGKDIYGNIISISPPEDMIFEIGSYTHFSDDNLKIYASEEGQPHLDAMGAISVYPELRIEGDVAYETGNVNFNGNLVVSGTIREGFSVRCANLTADQIHGAEINITGNLNVSSGIINSNVINVQGHIQTKYVNNSQLKSFGNVIVQREIIDSKIYTSGECVNERGSILSSFIYAKGGVRAGSIGTVRAVSSQLEIGIDRLMNMIIAELDEGIKKNNDNISLLKKEIQELDDSEKQLLEKITNYAQEQDIAQTELRRLKNQLPDIKKSKNQKSLEEALKTIQELQLTTMEAEKVIEEAFEQQDNMLGQINDRKKDIKEFEDSNKTTVHKKRAMQEYSHRSKPKAELTVQKIIMAGTLIKGEKSKLLLNQNHKRCRIHEIKISEDMSDLSYEFRISNL